MFPQRIHRRDAGSAKGGHHAKNDRRRHHRRGGKRQDAPVERQVESDRRGRRGQLRGYRSARPSRKHEAEDRANDSQGQAFREQLPRKPPP
jgi:hypothetical protein